MKRKLWMTRVLGLAWQLNLVASLHLIIVPRQAGKKIDDVSKFLTNYN